MSNKVLIGIVAVLVVAGGAYYLGTMRPQSAAPASQAMPVPDTENSGNETVVTNDSAAKMSPEAGRAVGKWKSTEDAKFTREFREDGTVTDRYEGDASATSSGTWSQVVNVSAEPVQLPAVGNATILKLVMDGEAYYFAISADTTVDKLVLINLGGRGNILSFTRMN